MEKDARRSCRFSSFLPLYPEAQLSDSSSEARDRSSASLGLFISKTLHLICFPDPFDIYESPKAKNRKSLLHSPASSSNNPFEEKECTPDQLPVFPFLEV